jgi:hypothetical protein
MNLRALLKSLDGYSEEKFDRLFGKFTELGLINEDDNYFYQRIYNHIKNKIDKKKPQASLLTAQSIYLHLEALYSLLKHSLDSELKDKKLRDSALMRMQKAMEILNVCNLSYG